MAVIVPFPARHRRKVMDLVIAECHGNVTLRVAIEAAHRLGYSITEIGGDYFVRQIEGRQEK